jgi:hypothetical protein
MMGSATAGAAGAPTIEVAGSDARALDDVLFLAVVLSWTAAAIHVVAAYSHAGESALHAVAFAAVAVAQLAWGVAVYRGAGPAVLASGAVLSLAVVAAWIASRTVGLPLGPEAWSPEPVGIHGLLATVDEIVLALIVAARLTVPGGDGWPGGLRSLSLVVGVSLVLLSTVALTLGGGHAH